MEYGYIRVSSKDQNQARQFAALAACGVRADNMYEDKQSGKDFERPAYTRLLRRLKQGDVLYVLSIDRLGRNYDEILEQWRMITKQKGADIVVLDFPLLDTRTKSGNEDLTGRFVADMVLQILAYVAQKERENIRQRQAEGIAAAKARGQRWGRKEKHLPPDFPHLYAAWRKGELNEKMLLERCAMKRSTFYKHLSKYREMIMEKNG